MKTIDEIEKELAEPFDPLDIEWRIQRTSKDNKGAWVLAYIDNRAVMNRLDKVVGAFNWRNTKTQFKDGVVDTIEIRNPDNPAEWVGKSDGADPTQIEPFRGAMSDSMKRSAVLWGIGRYLYQLESFRIPLIEGYKKDDDWYKVELKDPKNPSDKIWYSWHPPELPEWALPKGNTRSVKLSEAKDLCIEKLTVIYGKEPIWDWLVEKIDKAKHQSELDDLMFYVSEAQKETEKQITDGIVAGWNALKYTLTHQANSMKKPEHLGTDSLSECHDIIRLYFYRKHLRDNFRTEKKGENK